jgi:hypothetical protein
MFYQLTNEFAETEKAKVDILGARCEEKNSDDATCERLPVRG